MSSEKAEVENEYQKDLRCALTLMRKHSKASMALTLSILINTWGTNSQGLIIEETLNNLKHTKKKHIESTLKNHHELEES